MKQEDDIAIVGIGCRFPGADDLDEFWRVLSNGENHVLEIPKEKWDLDEVYDPNPDAPRKTNVRRAGFVKNYHEWDHKFFGISEMAAVEMDPQQRMVLDCVHMALEDGGIRRQDIDGSYTGVYIGSMNDDFKSGAMVCPEKFGAYTVTGLNSSIISARVSYVYNLHGPAVTLDTACSSSLVAINIAEHALKLGTCDAAICGGVNSIIDSVPFVALSKARMLSPTGQSKPFSADADGYARGEGCGIIILKRLSEAVKDGNKIWGTLRSGSNQDGQTATPITSPSGSMQLDLLQRLYTESKVDKHSVQVIEAHGTGTPVGDPIEANALGKFFGKTGAATKQTFIGSVKSNIGHTEAAAGVAGLTKILLMMKYGQIVPSLFVNEASINPKINLDLYGFEIPFKTMHWNRPQDGRRIACVNSFGFGGTNAHAIVHEHVSSPTVVSVNDKKASLFPYFVTISALDESSLVDQVRDFTHRLKERDYDMGSLSYTSIFRRDHNIYRKAFSPESQQEMIEMCQRYLEIPTGQTQFNKTKVVFVFCGVGTTWDGMCSFMMKLQAFRQTIEAVDEYLLPLSGWTLSSKFSNRVDVTTDPLVSHVAIFGCQVGLVEVWKSFGITPDLVVGQSVGEVAAAYVSGSIDLKSAVRVIYYRSKFLSEVKKGAMAVVRNVDTHKIEEICKATDGKLNVAVYNSPTSCTISGEKTEIDLLRRKLKTDLGAEDGILIDLNVTCAYHSPFVETAAKRATQMLKNLTAGNQAIPIISTVSGVQEKHETFVDEIYWEKNMECPVRFGDAILVAAAHLDTEQTVFIEIGPGPVLGAHLKSLFQSRNTNIVLPSMRKEYEKETLCKTICTLFELGLHLKWETLICTSNTVTDIPRYIFRRQITPYREQHILAPTATHVVENRDHLYIKSDTTAIECRKFDIHVNQSNTSFVFEHIVKGSILIPGAFHADIGFEIAQKFLAIPISEAVVSLEFTETAKIEQGTQNILVVDIVQINETEFHFFVKQGKRLVCVGKVGRQTFSKIPFHEHDKANTKHCSMGLNSNVDEFDVQGNKLDIQLLRLKMMGKLHRKMDSKAFYENLSKMGFQYGQCFQNMNECLATEGHCLGTFSIADDVFKDIDKVTVHPCVLDGMFQSTFPATHEKALTVAIQEQLLLVPVAVESIKVYGKPTSRTVYSYTKMTNATIVPNLLKIHYDILLLNCDGTVIIHVENYTTYCRRSTTFTPDELKYKLTWSPISLEPSLLKSPKTLVIHRSEHLKTGLDIFGENTAVCKLPSSRFTEYELSQCLEKAVKKKWTAFDEVDAIVILFSNDFNNVDINQATRDIIYATAKQNCLILTWLLRFSISNKQKQPLFIITENAQTIVSQFESNVNIADSAILGFIRNVLIELVHDKVFLVDLQPSFTDTKTTLVQFLSSAVHQTVSTQSEYIIDVNKILGASISKTRLSEVIPTMRISNVRHLHMNCTIMYDEGIRNGRPFLSPCPDKKKLLKHKQNFVELEVTSVSLSKESIMYTPSASDPENVGVQEDNTMEAVEYVGFKISSKQHVFCRKNNVADVDSFSSDRWQLAVVYPQRLTTRSMVPRDCTVNVKDLPFYMPNMLTYTILFWHFTRNIPKGVKVKIVSENDFAWLLERMLKTVALVTLVGSAEDGLPDVLVYLGQHNERMIDSINTATRIVCLKYSIPETHRKHLASYQGITIVEVDSSAVLKRKVISKTLKNVVPWLKRNISTEDVARNQISDDRSSSLDLRSLPFKLSNERLFGKNDVFVITGGLTGLGWQTILMLVGRGVDTVATISRRAVDEETKKNIKEVEMKHSCRILCFRGDVCDLQTVIAMIAELTKQFGAHRIRGIVHGAGVLDGKILAKLEESNFDRVMEPKIIGVLNLHIATAHLNIDYFIMHSSISSLLGMPGQGNYGAANAFLDSFARWRRSRGRPAQSINWGGLEVGMAAQDNFRSVLVKRGYNLLLIAEIWDCFIHSLMQNSTDVVYANLDWSVIAQTYSVQQLSRMAFALKEVMRRKNVDIMTQQNQSQETESEFNLEALQNADNTTRQRKVEKLIETAAIRAIAFDVARLNMKTPLAELGMESLAAVTFSNYVYNMTGHKIPEGALPSKTLRDVVTDICSGIFGVDVTYID